MPRSARTHEEFLERFWARVTKPNDDACWEWQGATVGGYGSLRHQQRHFYAHQLSYELAHGPIPAGMCVCHTCDNRRCCNPRHYFLGSRGDNLRDAAVKARMSHGEDRPTAKLTEDLVRKIRDRYVSEAISQKDLAREYGVSQTTISKLTRRVGWRLVT